MTPKAETLSSSKKFNIVEEQIDLNQVSLSNKSIITKLNLSILPRFMTFLLSVDPRLIVSRLIK